VIETLHHVSVSVTDLERARRFYREVLGLTEIPRPAFDFPGAWFSLGDRELHLLVHTTPRSLRGTTDVDPRDGHLALRVSDYDAMLERLRTHGVEAVASRVNPTPWSQLYLADPDGNMIELNVERPA
jgi:glyoxylase I family protein